MKLEMLPYKNINLKTNSLQKKEGVEEYSRYYMKKSKINK